MASFNRAYSFMDLYRMSNDMDVIIPAQRSTGNLYLGNIEAA